MKKSHRLNTSLISYVRDRLWVAELPDDMLNRPVARIISSETYKDFLRFQMYHLMVTNYIVNLKMLGKLNDETFERCLDQGATQKGLESLAATFLLESCQSFPLSDASELPDLVQVIPPYYVYHHKNSAHPQDSIKDD